MLRDCRFYPASPAHWAPPKYRSVLRWILLSPLSGSLLRVRAAVRPSVISMPWAGAVRVRIQVWSAVVVKAEACPPSAPASFLSPLLTAAVAGNLQAQTGDSALKLNQIQVIGTHNSYHAGIAPNESKIWQANMPSLQRARLPASAASPQFDSGVRQIELDVYADTKGGLYAHPSGPRGCGGETSGRS